MNTAEILETVLEFLEGWDRMAWMAENGEWDDDHIASRQSVSTQAPRRVRGRRSCMPATCSRQSGGSNAMRHYYELESP